MTQHENDAAWPDHKPTALLVLADGTVLEGFGLGQRLMEAVVAHATGRVEQLQLGVGSDNKAARRLYEKMGFSEYGREMKALKQDGRYFDEILMVRFLVPAEAIRQKRM